MGNKMTKVIVAIRDFFHPQKKVYKVYEALKEMERVTDEVEDNVEKITTLNGESEWLLCKPKNFDECVDECGDKFDKSSDGG